MTQLDSKTRQQIRVYSNWVANKLKGVETCKVNDVTTDLSDGTALIELAEILTKAKAPLTYKKKTKINSPVQQVQKCDYAIQMFRDNGIDLGNSISGKDIHDKNVQQTLYLIWMLILNYSIDPAVREEQNFQYSKDNTNTDVKNIATRNKLQLLTWATDKVKKYKFVEDKFEPYDLSMFALIHEYYPEEINYDALDKDNHDANLKLLVEKMERLQIPVLITPQDLKEYNYKVDEDCLMTQLSALKCCLDKKFPMRKSVVSRQNRKAVTPNKANLNQKPGNLRPPTITKKVSVDDGSNINTPTVINDTQLNQINLEKTKSNSKGSKVFILDPSQKVTPIIKKNDSSTKTGPKWQIESTSFDIQPDSSQKLKNVSNINNGSGKKFETNSFGVQPDNNFTSSTQKSQTSKIDFGVQPSSDSEKVNDENQVQKRDINMEISVESLDSDDDQNQNNSKKKNNNRKNLEIGGLNEKQFLKNESDSNSINKNNNDITDKQKAKKPITRKKNNLKNRRKFNPKRRNTYHDSLSNQNLFNDSNPPLNSDVTIEEEEEDNDSNQNPKNNKFFKTRDILTNQNNESDEGTNNNAIITSKSKNDENSDDSNPPAWQLVVNSDEENNNKDKNDEEDEEDNKKEKNDEIKNNDNDDNKNRIKINKNKNKDDSDNGDDENRIKINKNKNKDDEDENKDEEEEEESEQVYPRKRHQKVHRKQKHTKHRHKRFHSKRPNTRTKSKHFNDDEEDARTEEETEEELSEIKPIKFRAKYPIKTKDDDNEIDSDEIRNRKRPSSTRTNTAQTQSIKTRSLNLQTTSNEEEEEEEDLFDNRRRNQSRNRKKLSVQTDFNENKLIETRDVGIQSPKSHKSRTFDSNETSSKPKTLRIKVNGKIDKPIVITVRNFSHHDKKNESSRRLTHSGLNSPNKDLTDSHLAYRSHSSHRSHSHHKNTNPTSYSVPNTPNYNSKKECSIVPVINESDGNKTRSRKFRVHVKDQDLKVKKNFDDSISGIKITLNDKNSQNEENEIDS